MDQDNPRLEADRQAIVEAQGKGIFAKLKTYTRLSGPGWLQSAITLGGGSLASALYLGVLAGYELLWVQLIAMIMGVIMLSAIAYVTLSTGKRPFQAINEHINPVLGWSWAIATLMANMVWCLPQFSLGVASVRQNLLPGVFGEGAMDPTQSKLIVGGILLAIATIIVFAYDSGGRSVKIFEGVLKGMVGVVVLSFLAVVIVMTVNGAINWGEIFGGFVPDFSLLDKPSGRFDDILAASGRFSDYWSGRIVGDQQDVIISAAATAVGINMTFLLPYSMLARGWKKEFRGLATFDLSTGLLIPYIVATSCVVIAAAAAFHTHPAPGLLGELDDKGVAIVAKGGMVDKYNDLRDHRVTHEWEKTEAGKAELKKLKDEQKEYEGKVEAKRPSLTADEYKAAMKGGPLNEELKVRREALPDADKRIAAMLVKRDADDLAVALEPVTSKNFSHFLFGIGVLGMALSTIIILMLISGFTVCEMLNIPARGWPRRFACMLSAVGFLGPFYFSGKTAFWLAVPTSVFGFMLLPIAFWTFFGMMNSKSLMGEHRPRGMRRVVWNAFMLVAVTYATVGAAWNIWNRTQLMFGIEIRWIAIGVAGLILLLALIAHVRRKRPA